MRNKLFIILPTYNEKENIKEVINKINKLNLSCTIVVVDDASPDGTSNIVGDLKKDNPNLVLINRKGKRGRGLAGKEGFLYALSKKADFILEMDADLSHNPEDILKLYEAIKKYDVVLGSRYIKGGKVMRPWYREVSSFFGGKYVKLILSLPRNITDPTSGFRIFKRSTLVKINISTLKSKGPPIITEILLRCKKMKIGEIPIIFNDRKKGKSKLTIKILLTSLFLPLKWRINEFLK